MNEEIKKMEPIPGVYWIGSPINNKIEEDPNKILELKPGL